MKKRILEILLISGLIILEKMGEVSFFQAIIIYISAIVGDIIIQKLEVIIGLLKEIDKGEKINVRL